MQHLFNQIYITSQQNLILHMVTVRRHRQLRHLTVAIAIHISRKRRCLGRTPFMLIYSHISTRAKEITGMQDHMVVELIRKTIFILNLLVSPHPRLRTPLTPTPMKHPLGRQSPDLIATQVAHTRFGRVEILSSPSIIVHRYQIHHIMCPLS